MKLTAENFLGLPDLVWEASGVCLLTGPNGSGKTSLLNAFAFLRGVFLYGVPRAVQFLGGARGFKRRGTPPELPVRVSLQVDEVTWTLEIFANAGALSEYPGERLTVNGQVVLRRIAGSNEWSLGDQRVTDTLDDEPRSCLRSAWDRSPDARWSPIIEALRGLRIYNQRWSVPRLWDDALPFNEQVFLDAKGSNLFSVLHNWRANPRRYRDQFEWVRRHARNAFGDIFDDLEIVPLGDAVSVTFYGPDDREGLPARRAADGLIVGLLHLTAIAGMREGSLTAIDEMENQLHPHAIRVILGAMREIAEERDLTVILTTHSPVVMNEFADVTSLFWVAERSHASFPVPLDQLHDPRWLAQSSLGGLYERLRIAAPVSKS